MTQQESYRQTEEAGSSSASTSGASTSSTDVYPLPFSIGQKEIVLNNDEGSLVSNIPEASVLPPGTNVCVTDSTNVTVGNRTFFNSDVTIYQYINGNTLPEIENGHDEVQCNKNVRVITPPTPTTPIDKPIASKGFFRRHFKAIMILLTIATVVCAVTLIVLRLLGTKKPSYVVTTTEEPGTTTSAPSKIHHTFDKEQWGGRTSANPEAFDEPVSLVIVKHTNTESCTELSTCFSAMQNLQSVDVGTNHLGDIQYNFVIGGDGNIYEGRGWGVRNAQLNNTIDIAFMGNFNVEMPSEWVVGAGLHLVVMGMLNGHLNSSYTRVVCHNQTEDTDSPGENLYREVVKWEYYSYEIINGSTWKIDL